MNIADERGHPIKNKYYNSGSTIELQCTVNRIPEAQVILWKWGTKVLNFDNSRGGISVKADVTDNGALSRLFIANSHPHDSGNYTCALGDIAQASVTVVVLNGKDGEAPAAMHIGASSLLLGSQSLVLVGTLIALSDFLSRHSR
ncbi:hypothetical protein GE061_013460 [Apolygus lucorum]|uniref:Uncharacterized protein n=1 Tax=Apolygus lucorum TaxID=248454 RepID=A0A6A4J8S1_APOLU|nr:hypothetical protein GE061_013460 [Apolygus lucorum]